MSHSPSLPHRDSPPYPTPTHPPHPPHWISHRYPPWAPSCIYNIYNRLYKKGETKRQFSPLDMSPKNCSKVVKNERPQVLGVPRGPGGPKGRRQGFAHHNTKALWRISGILGGRPISNPQTTAKLCKKHNQLSNTIWKTVFDNRRTL